MLLTETIIDKIAEGVVKTTLLMVHQGEDQAKIIQAVKRLIAATVHVPLVHEWEDDEDSHQVVS